MIGLTKVVSSLARLSRELSGAATGVNRNDLV
jgi:hypothetical protein